MSDLKTEIQKVVNSGNFQVAKSKPPKRAKRKGRRSTGELTLRALRWLLGAHLGDENGLPRRPNEDAGRELLREIDDRIKEYDAERE